MRFVIITLIIYLWCLPVYALTVNEHAADSSNPHGSKMKITEKLSVGTGDDYAAGFALKVEGGATIDSLNLGGGNLTFGTASSPNGSLSIGTTTAGSSRIRVIGTITATTFVGDGTFLTGVGAGTGSGNWTDSGSSTQTLYPDTVTRKVAVGSTTTNGNQFAVDGTARIYGTLTATKFVGDGSLLTGISAGDGTETIWANNGSTTSQGTVTQNIVIGSTTAAANQKLTVVGSSTFRDTYIGGILSIGTGGSSLIGGTPTINLAIGDSDSGFRHISDGIYAAVGNGDDQIVIDGTADKVYIGTSTGDTKLFVKGDIKATGTITAAFFSGNGAGLTGISSTDVKWTDTGEALQPGTITYKLRLGTTTANGATLQVEGSATVGGTLSATVVIANAPDGETSDAIANAGQLAEIKAEMLTEIIDHTVATSDIHGVGSSTIASMQDITNHDGSVTAHYATSTATANTPILRDSNGRAQIATGTSNLDIANVGQVGDYRFIRVLLSSGSADTPVYFLTDAEIGSKSAYLISFIGQVYGSTAWTAGTMTKIEMMDTTGLNVFFGITLASLIGNAQFYIGAPGVGLFTSFTLRTGTSVGKGLKLVADGTATGGSNLYITALIKIE